jgi:hypothetical protein
MKSPRWPVFLIAILLGLATGDAVLLTPAHAESPTPHELLPTSQPSLLHVPSLSGKKA